MPESYYEFINEKIEDKPTDETEGAGVQKLKRENRRKRREKEGKGPQRPLKVSESKEAPKEEPETAEKQIEPGMVKVEHGSGKKEKLREGIKRLEEYTVNRANELRKRGIMVDDECRIDMNDFKDNSDYIRDNVKVIKRDRKIEKIMNDPKNVKRKERKEKSEQMEMFKTALLSEVLGAGYVVCRSSKYDDYENGVDNVIVRDDGIPMAAFDEALHDDSEFNKESIERFKAKKEKVEKINELEGATIKYCYGKENDDTSKFVKKEQKKVPLLYLDLTYAELNEGLRDFGSMGARPGSHQKILDKFFSSLNEQMPILKEMGFNVSSFETDFIEIAEKEGINVESESGCYVAYGKRGTVGSGRLAAA